MLYSRFIISQCSLVGFRANEEEMGLGWVAEAEEDSRREALL